MNTAEQQCNRLGLHRLISRFAAAILSVNDTLTDNDERERMRRAVLDTAELMEFRIADWMVGKYDAGD